MDKNIQVKFNQLIELLESKESENTLIVECLDASFGEIDFHYSTNKDQDNRKSVIDIYTRRSKLDLEIRKENLFVIGYETLIPNLHKSKIEKINISMLTTFNGTYIIFSDVEYKEWIGIIKSRRTLIEVREKMQMSKVYTENIFVKRLSLGKVE